MYLNVYYACCLGKEYVRESKDVPLVAKSNLFTKESVHLNESID